MQRGPHTNSPRSGRVEAGNLGRRGCSSFQRATSFEPPGLPLSRLPALPGQQTPEMSLTPSSPPTSRVASAACPAPLGDPSLFSDPSLGGTQRNSALPGRGGKQWAFRSRRTPPCRTTILEFQPGREDCGFHPGAGGSQLSPALAPLCTLRPGGTFGHPRMSRLGCHSGVANPGLRNSPAKGEITRR